MPPTSIKLSTPIALFNTKETHFPSKSSSISPLPQFSLPFLYYFYLLSLTGSLSQAVRRAMAAPVAAAVAEVVHGTGIDTLKEKGIHNF